MEERNVFEIAADAARVVICPSKVLRVVMFAPGA
jgi:hypothetical protein